jgi:hypothetical protein
MQPEPKRENSADQEHTYERAPHIIDVGPNPPETRQPNEIEQHRASKVKPPWWRRQIKRASKPMSIYTLLLTGFAGYQMWTQDAQAERIARAITQGVGQAKTTVESILNDNRAAMSAALNQGRDASVRASELDQRAWLGVAEIGIEASVDGVKPTINGWIQNSGKTPALNTRIRFVYRTFLSTESPSLYFTSDDNPKPSFVVPPQMKLPFTGVDNWHDQPLNKKGIQSGGFKVYVYGTVTYDDTFGRQHTTRACAWFDKDLYTAHPCATFNDAN